MERNETDLLTSLEDEVETDGKSKVNFTRRSVSFHLYRIKFHNCCLAHYYLQIYITEKDEIFNVLQFVMRH